MSLDSCCAGGLSRTFAGHQSLSNHAITVVVAGAGGQIGHCMLPMIANGDLFGKFQRVVIHGLDLDQPSSKGKMKGLQLQLEDGNYPLLEKVKMSTDEKEAFSNADYAILLGSWPSSRSKKEEVLKMNVLIFKTMGKALEAYAKKDCKVIVFGRPYSTNAWICAQFAPSLPKSNFTAVTRLQHNRALGLLAQRIGVSVGDIRNLIV